MADRQTARGIGLDKATAETLVLELRQKGHDDRTLIDHVCNRLRIKKQVAEPIVRAYKAGLHARVSQAGDTPVYDGEHAVMFHAAYVAQAAKPESVPSNKAESRPMPAATRAAPGKISKLHDAIYSEKDQRESIVISSLFIGGATFWLTDMSGVNAWFMVLIVTLPWVMLRVLQGTIMENYTLYIILMAICISASYNIGNGFPWAALIVGFIGTHLATAERERRHAQRVLNAYGIEEVRKIYGSRFDIDLEQDNNK